MPSSSVISGSNLKLFHTLSVEASRKEEEGSSLNLWFSAFFFSLQIPKDFLPVMNLN